MVVINDISERARLRESKVSEMLKTIMLCSISHELRSPVNQINGVLTLLLPTLETKEQKHLIKIANSSTELLKLKVDDMLDFYEAETKNFKPEKKPFDPRKLFAYLKTIFSPMIDHTNIKLYFFIHERTPEMIFHDMDRIKQVLVNIMSNSVKYTKKGVISAIIDWEDDKRTDDERCGLIKFTISDTGSGIPKHKKKNLFTFLDPQNFKELLKGRDCDPNTTKLAGTGLGISQKIMHGLGSKIEFTSTEGSGSKFWFKLKTKTRNVVRRDSLGLRKIIFEQEKTLNDGRQHASYTICGPENSTFRKKLKKCASMPAIKECAEYNMYELNDLHYSVGLENSASVEDMDFGLDLSSFKLRKKVRKIGSDHKIIQKKVDCDSLSVAEEGTCPIVSVPEFVFRAGDLDHKVNSNHKEEENKHTSPHLVIPASTKATFGVNTSLLPYTVSHDVVKEDDHVINLDSSPTVCPPKSLKNVAKSHDKDSPRKKSAFSNYDKLMKHQVA